VTGQQPQAPKASLQDALRRLAQDPNLSGRTRTMAAALADRLDAEAQTAPMLARARALRAEAARLEREARSSTGGTARTGGTDHAAVRAWARSAGMKVADHGRLPADVVAAYAEAHQGGAA
jgi:hypothetical protein